MRMRALLPFGFVAALTPSASCGRPAQSRPVMPTPARASTPQPYDAKKAGTLPPEVIQRTVRANFGRFRRCYESHLRS